MEEKIIEILDKTAISTSDHGYTCTFNSIQKVERALRGHKHWKMELSLWPDETGGTAAVAFMEDNELQLIMWDYKYIISGD